MEIKIVNQLSDNYSYVLYNDIDRKTIVIDPADEIPIIDLILNEGPNSSKILKNSKFSQEI